MCTALATVANQGGPAAAYVTGEVVAVEAAVPRAPPPPPVAAQSYEYYMDGRHMGRLHLDQVQKKCSWTSYLTGNTTAWRGEWHTFPSGNLVCFFDYEGRENRTIRIGQIDFWQYNTATGNYQYVRRG